MAQVDTPTWLAWVAPLGVIMGALWAGARRLLISVTREELREAIRDSNHIIDARHAEHLKRLDKQDEELKEIRGGLHRLEGVISGKYPRIDR